MTFGDGLAGLVGKSFNSKSWIIFKQKKSLLGTMTMFLTSLIVVCLVGYAQQNSFNLNYFAIAFLATFLEQFSFLGIDNLIVPISSALFFNFFITN
jgi:phytol kinase